MPMNQQQLVQHLLMQEKEQGVKIVGSGGGPLGGSTETVCGDSRYGP